MLTALSNLTSEALSQILMDFTGPPQKFLWTDPPYIVYVKTVIKYLINSISEWCQTLSTWEMFPMGPVVEEPRASSAGGVRLHIYYLA